MGTVASSVENLDGGGAGHGRVLVSVLGPVAVAGAASMQWRDRVVLGVLVVRSPASAAVDDIAWALWGDGAPESQRKVIQGSIVRLRRMLGRDAIRTGERGYVLDLDRTVIDAPNFVSLIDDARVELRNGYAERALRTVSSALELWRGEPLPELDGWEPAETESRRLVAVHDAAEELVLEARLRAGQFDTLAANAELLAAAKPYHEARWMLWARILYATGRQVEALDVVRRLARTLRDELGVEPNPEAIALELAILRQDPDLVVPASIDVDAGSPWPGLLPYEHTDAERFFGREADVDRAVARLRMDRCLVVVGRSGVGKSSFVRAGLVPRLVSEGEQVVVVTPGSGLADQLARLPDSACLVVDQAEELVTRRRSGQSPVDISRWLDRREGRKIVLVARADLLDDLAVEPGIADLLGRGVFVLRPLDEPGLRAAVEGPAERGGVRLEPGLVELLLEECRQQAGALPLLSHALSETWHRAEGNLLTVHGYRASGGIGAAIATTADGVYSLLDDAQRVQMRSLFRRLVRFDGDEPVRAHVPRGVADPALVERLVSARLLVASDDGSVQIAHEHLACHWPRLTAWATEDREGDRLLRHLSDEARDWAASGRPASLLYRGVRLAAATDWAASHDAELDGIERAFIEESVRRSDEDLRQARRTNSRLRLALMLTAVLLAASASVTAFAVYQRANARAARASEQTARAASDALRFGAEAAAIDDPSLALLLVAQSLSVGDSEAGRRQALDVFGRFRSLVSTRQQPPGTAWPAGVERIAGGEFATAPDGSLRAEVADGSIRFTTASGEDAGVIDGLPVVPNALAFDPTGRLLAAGFSEEGFPDTGVTVVWDVEHGGEVARFDSGSGQVWAHRFDPDGGSIYSFGADGLHEWDLTGARAIVRTGDGVPLSFRAGDTVLSMTDDSVEGWIAEACRLAGRSMTDGEWSTLIGPASYEPAC